MTCGCFAIACWKIIDWKQAADAYAADHDGYYGALHRLTGWMRTLANDPRPEAAAIRAKVLPIIANDPSVFPISADLDPRPQAMTWRIGVYSEICKRFP